MPKTSSAAGTDMSPISIRGFSRGPGTCPPAADTTTPDSEPTAIGFRNGVSTRRHTVPFSPVPDRSSTVSATGVTRTTWNSSTGATRDASPRTYAAIGMPRLPELT